MDHSSRTKLGTLQMFGCISRTPSPERGSSVDEAEGTRQKIERLKVIHSTHSVSPHHKLTGYTGPSRLNRASHERQSRSPRPREEHKARARCRPRWLAEKAPQRRPCSGYRSYSGLAASRLSLSVHFSAGHGAPSVAQVGMFCTPGLFTIPSLRLLSVFRIIGQGNT